MNQVTPIVNKANDATKPLSPGYSTGLFDEVINPIAIFCVCCFPCCPIAKTKANLDGRDVKCLDFCNINHPWQARQQMRFKYGMGYNGILDCVTLICLPWCAICQDLKESSSRSGKAPDYFQIPEDI